MSKKVLAFIKSEIVLEAALVLAAVSAFFVHPDRQYSSYIDYRTLAILLSLMLVTAGCTELKLFRQAGEALAGRMRSSRGLAAVLIGLCFVSSMFITNDVALITFVPFSVITLTAAGLQAQLITVITLETIAANLGSMALPMGNPQNLYLYSAGGFAFSDFVLLMLPYTLLAAGLLIVSLLIRIRRRDLQIADRTPVKRSLSDKLKIVMYAVCFLISILAVLRVLDYRITVCAVTIAVLLFDRKRLLKVDYSLLFTFVFLFIFIGNMKRIPAVSEMLGNLITGRETVVSILLSQIISNVPAAILCAGFTDNLKALVIGTNLGGLGTLIASMASLISFKQYCKTPGAKPGKYILEFTVWNLIFLAILFLGYLIMMLCH